MEIRKGIGVSPGVAMCQARVLDTEEVGIPHRQVPPEQVSGELERLELALRASQDEVAQLRDRAAQRLGAETAAIFDFHLAMLSDQALAKKIQDVISGESVTAEYATASALRNYAKAFLPMPEFFAERAKDVYDIEKRILRHLIGQSRTCHLSWRIMKSMKRYFL